MSKKQIGKLIVWGMLLVLTLCALEGWFFKPISVPRKVVEAQVMKDCMAAMDQLEKMDGNPEMLMGCVNELSDALNKKEITSEDLNMGGYNDPHFGKEWLKNYRMQVKIKCAQQKFAQLKEMAEAPGQKTPNDVWIARSLVTFIESVNQEIKDVGNPFSQVSDEKKIEGLFKKIKG